MVSPSPIFGSSWIRNRGMNEHKQQKHSGHCGRRQFKFCWFRLHSFDEGETKQNNDSKWPFLGGHQIWTMALTPVRHPLLHSVPLHDDLRRTSCGLTDNASRREHLQYGGGQMQRHTTQSSEHSKRWSYAEHLEIMGKGGGGGRAQFNWIWNNTFIVGINSRTLPPGSWTHCYYK